jgi:hypothetical protein
MKALVTAFALLSFVAASTVPVVAHAATKTEHTAKKKVHKKHVKKVSKKSSAKKRVGKAGQAA